MTLRGWRGDSIKVLQHNGERFILDGHHRVAAARRVGLDVPYQSVTTDKLADFGYGSIEAVLRSATEAGPIRLR